MNSFINFFKKIGTGIVNAFKAVRLIKSAVSDNDASDGADDLIEDAGDDV